MSATGSRALTLPIGYLSQAAGGAREESEPHERSLPLASSKDAPKDRRAGSKDSVSTADTESRGVPLHLQLEQRLGRPLPFQRSVSEPLEDISEPFEPFERSASWASASRPKDLLPHPRKPGAKAAAKPAEREQPRAPWPAAHGEEWDAIVHDSDRLERLQEQTVAERGGAEAALHFDLKGAFAGECRQSLRKLEEFHLQRSATFRRARMDLVRHVQKQVLPSYGFDANPDGVNRMVQAMASHADDEDVRSNAATIDRLIGLPHTPLSQLRTKGTQNAPEDTLGDVGVLQLQQDLIERLSSAQFRRELRLAEERFLSQSKEFNESRVQLLDSFMHELLSLREQ